MTADCSPGMANAAGSVVPVARYAEIEREGGRPMGMMWFWLLIALGMATAVWLIARVIAGPRRRRSLERSIERRYLEGEFDRHEYERRLAALNE
jgi:hypothetical protein